MNYKIIIDEVILHEFVEWLPDLKENECFYISLFSRKKYCQSLIKSNDKTQLKRFTANKTNLIDKIRQLEAPLGAYKLGDMNVPQESLVLYIMPNPRCMVKACRLMLTHCAELLAKDAKGYNLHQESLRCIQKSKSYNYIVDFDIDTKEVDLKLLNRVLPSWDNQYAYDILETKGGYHILVNPTRAETIDKNCKCKFEL